MESEKNHAFEVPVLYLSDRVQMCKVNQTLSNKKNPLNVVCNRAQILAHYCFYYILTIFQIACLHRLPVCLPMI